MRSFFFSIIFFTLIGMAGLFFVQFVSSPQHQSNDLILIESSLHRMQRLTVIANEGIYFPGLCVGCSGRTSYRKLPVQIQASLRTSNDQTQFISLNVIGRANPLNWTVIAADGSFEKIIQQNYGDSHQILSLTYKGKVSGTKITLSKFDLKLVQSERQASHVLKSIDL
jgi:hypothetical protein